MRCLSIFGWVASVVVLGLSGCGMPAAPAPPSLNLATVVDDLSASRAGDLVTLNWTLPKRNTDHLLLKGNLDVIVCRKLPTGECLPAKQLSLAPGQKVQAELQLPTELANGAARDIRYAVQIRNQSGRSAGLSNVAVVLGGQAPPAVDGLTAEITRQGVVLKWSAGSGAKMLVRLIRRHLTTKAATKTTGEQNLLAAPPEPEVLSLLTAGDVGRALDKTLRVESNEQQYEYRAERVVQVTVDNKTLELTSPLSAPVGVVVKNVYPPDRPAGLVAVADSAEATALGIDLSWQPSLESGLTGSVAGYVVYRREADATWTRISGNELVIGPAFHDAKVQAAHSYRYAVSAVGSNGHESPRSEEASESLPDAATDKN